MIRTILVALDESERVSGVLRATVEIGAKFLARVRPLRAELRPEVPPEAAGSPLDPLLEPPSKRARRDLDRLVADMADVAMVAMDSPIVRVGEPARILLEAGEELDVGPVVVGSHGYDAIDPILGTTAGRVANQSKRSVLDVHERTAGNRDLGPLRLAEEAN